MGESVLFFNILFSFETSFYINILNLTQPDVQFLAEELSRCGISHCKGEKLQVLPWYLARVRCVDRTESWLDFCGL